MPIPFINGCVTRHETVSKTTRSRNFHKFLVDEEGRLVASLRSGVGPLDDVIVDFAKR